MKKLKTPSALFLLTAITLAIALFCRLVAPASYRFIFLGDTGTGDENQLKVAQAVKEHCDKYKNCQAVFILGDVICDEGVESIDDPQFTTKFEEPYKDINLPFYIAYGNHDYLGCTDCYLQYSNISEKWKMPSPYYKLSFADLVSFLVINTEAFNSQQQNWLKQKLEKSHTPFKIVLGHKPLVTYETNYIKRNWPGKKELKNIVCQTADFYISGHAHLLEDNGILENCQVRQLISGGGGSTPRKIYPPHGGEFYFEGNGFLSLSVSEGKIEYAFFDKEGTLLQTATKTY